jgi:hypothetical protein
MTRVAGWSLVIALGWGAIRAPADEPPVPTSDVRAARGVEAIAGIGRQVQKLGEWDEMYEMLAPGFDAIWEQNAWNEEADQFALETLHELASIPPWQIQQRMDFLLETIRGRYDLTDAQYNDVRARFQGMIGELAWKHGGTIFRQTREAVQTRLDGRPFTPEQIARWTRESEPLFAMMRERVDGHIEDLAKSFTPQQSATLERDLASYRRRITLFEEMRGRWAQGQWRPEDWGLHADPLHEPILQRRADLLAKADAAREIGRGVFDYAEDSWSRYVREFIRRYQLNDAQAEAAWSILRELTRRAEDYRRRYELTLAEIPANQRATATAYAPLRAMFAELQRRLEPIPTQAQRRRAQKPPPRPPRTTGHQTTPATSGPLTVPPE